MVAFYSCLHMGIVSVTIHRPHPQNLQTTFPMVQMIVDVSKSAVILSTAQVIKLLNLTRQVTWWTLNPGWSPYPSTGNYQEYTRRRQLSWLHTWTSVHQQQGCLKGLKCHIQVQLLFVQL